MIERSRMAELWRRHRLKLMGAGLLGWVAFIAVSYLDVKRGQRAGPAGADELLQIGALPVT
jgi:hypothetical protein